MLKKNTHRHRKQAKGKRGINEELGVNRYTLMYIKQINKKDFLYSTEKNTQYLAITNNTKEYEKENIYICESLCRTPETNTALSIKHPSIF